MTTAARASADAGLIGLAVMGDKLARNIADHGYCVAVYNRTAAVVERFVAGHGDTRGGLVGAAALPEFVAALKPDGVHSVSTLITFVIPGDATQTPAVMTTMSPRRTHPAASAAAKAPSSSSSVFAWP
jgi:3-hydroxyisobutyrate dehydrogenase-like beta-hydroxyacid dehydrogenase